MNLSDLRSLIALATLAGLQALAAPAAVAQEAEKQLGWFDKAELTFVLTAGNAETNTFGAKNTLERIWERSSLRFEAGAIRTESTIKTRTAVGTPDNFTVSEDSESEKTAENFFARGRYDQNVSKVFFVFAGAGWDRNTFAGIDNRYSFVGGAGNIWFDTDRSRFRTDYGITYTIQKDVVPDPTKSDNFAGFRVSYDYRRVLTSNTNFASLLVVDDSFKETDDIRADFTNSIAVAMSQNLALKTSLQLLFDNLPSLTGIALENPVGTPTGDIVTTELDKLDSIFTVALVVNF